MSIGTIRSRPIGSCQSPTRTQKTQLGFGCKRISPVAQMRVVQGFAKLASRGILGYGCIGRQCARLARALGMDVHAFTLREKPTPESRKDESFVEEGLGDPGGDLPSRWFHGRDQLNDFLSGLDWLVITLPLTESTRGIISKEQFEALGKRKAFVTNASRGPVVITDDLVEALNSGTIKGAALDVTDPEPLPSDHPLWKAKNAVITPHVSGNSTHYNERALKILRENIKRRAEGRPIINRVNRSLGY